MASTLTPKSKTRDRVQTQEHKKRIPDVLIYEMVQGTPIYYRDYQEVIRGRKLMEEVMGSSFLQSLIISRLIRFLLQSLPAIYEVLTNELGLQFSKKHWRAADIAIYHKKQLETVLRENTYLVIPPKIIIEVDTKADIEQLTTPLDYYYAKTDEFLAFGVEKVIWIFTDAHKIMIAEPKRDWIIVDWERDIHVIDDISVNVPELLNE